MQHDPLLAARLRTRHYGLDWLRIAAFALLILYHVAMVFAPWDWVIQTPHRYAWLIPPMALLTPWRLPLLFAVSGYASRMLMERSPGIGAFARSRARRLLIPLAFGMVVLVPPEMWVRVVANGYPRGYLHFWAVDYWRWGRFYGRDFPSWEHLWFLAYLAAYTFVLAGLVAALGRRFFDALDRAADWLTEGRRLLLVPIAVLGIFKLALMFVAPERQGLLTDWGGHSQYFLFLLFGFTLAGAPQLWSTLARICRPALALAALSGAIVVAFELAYPGTAIPPHALMALDRLARVAMSWTTVIALFFLADRYANRDHRWRRPLAQAVFPFYLVHHLAIVLIAWATLPLGWNPFAEFALLLGGTAGACVVSYRIGRHIAWLRPLIGLGPRPKEGLKPRRRRKGLELPPSGPVSAPDTADGMRVVGRYEDDRSSP